MQKLCSPQLHMRCLENPELCVRPSFTLTTLFGMQGSAAAEVPVRLRAALSGALAHMPAASRQALTTLAGRIVAGLRPRW